MKKNLMKILRYILCFFVLLLIDISLIILMNKIPSNFLENNIKESAIVLKEQGERYIVNLGYKKETIFNFTDALMLNMAYSVDHNKPIDAMLLSRKDYIAGFTKYENTAAETNIGTDTRFIDKETGDVWHTKELYQFINEKDMEESFEYARYWHGYMILLRPLLVFFNISQIRLLFTIVLIGLSFVLLFLLYKKVNIFITIAFILGLIGCSIFILGQSIGETSVFFVTLIISIILLLKKDVNKNIGIIFFITGSIIGFTDLLTEPLISLFIPLTIYFLLIQGKEKINIKDVIKKYIFICIMWGIGYAITWMSKWIILDVIKHRGIFEQAIEQILYRSKSNKITYQMILERIYLCFSASSLYITVIIPLIVILIVGIFRTWNKKMKITINLIPFIINSVAPFVWYFLIKNHTWLHPFYLYKLLAISIINVFIIIGNILNLYSFKEEINRKIE